MSNTKTAKRRRKWKAKLAAGCLALGMATAWQGSAQAGTVAPTYLNITANTTQTISDAFIYYGIGNSQYALQSLGNLPQGHSTLSLIPSSVPKSSSYALVGLYGQGAGVALAFYDNTPIVGGASWESYFARPYAWPHYLEADVVSYVQAAVDGQTDDLKYFLYAFQVYYGIFPTQFGDEATLVCFSNATDGGTILAALSDAPLPPDPPAVPEPASWVLLVGMAGVALAGRRKLLG